MKHSPHSAASVMTLMCALVIQSGFAAERINIHGLSLDKANLHSQSLARLKTSTRHARLLNLEPGSDLIVINESTDKAGHHIRYQQRYLGLPIFNEAAVVSEDSNGNIRALFGKVILGLARDLPSVSFSVEADKASATAKNTWFAGRPEGWRVQMLSAMKSIYIDDTQRAHLVYVVTFHADNASRSAMTSPVVVIDGNSGRVLAKWEGIRH